VAAKLDDSSSSLVRDLVFDESLVDT